MQLAKASRLVLNPPQNLMHCSCNLLHRAELAFILNLELNPSVRLVKSQIIRGTTLIDH